MHALRRGVNTQALYGIRRRLRKAAGEGGVQEVIGYYLCNLNIFSLRRSVVSTLEIFSHSRTIGLIYAIQLLIGFPLCNNSEICRLLKLIHTFLDRQSAADDYFSANADSLYLGELPNEDYYAALTANRPYDNSEYLKRFDKRKIYPALSANSGTRFFARCLQRMRIRARLTTRNG